MILIIIQKLCNIDYLDVYPKATVFEGDYTKKYTCISKDVYFNILTDGQRF